MPDFFDKASDVEAHTLQNHLKAHAARAAAAPKLAPVGACQNPHCGEDFPAGDRRLFCNSRCAADHQRLTRT